MALDVREAGESELEVTGVFLDVGEGQVVVVSRVNGDGEGAGERGHAACFPV